jgi:hypothetical protein
MIRQPSTGLRGLPHGIMYFLMGTNLNIGDPHVRVQP